MYSMLRRTYTYTAKCNEEGKQVGATRLLAAAVTLREEQESFARKYLVLSNSLATNKQILHAGHKQTMYEKHAFSSSCTCVLS